MFIAIILYILLIFLVIDFLSMYLACLVGMTAYKLFVRLHLEVVMV